MGLLAFYRQDIPRRSERTREARELDATGQIISPGKQTRTPIESTTMVQDPRLSQDGSKVVRGIICATGQEKTRASLHRGAVDRGGTDIPTQDGAISSLDV